MRHVLDVNVALKWVLNEVDSTKARRLRDDWRAQIHELLHCPCGAARSARRPVNLSSMPPQPLEGKRLRTFDFPQDTAELLESLAGPRFL